MLQRVKFLALKLKIKGFIKQLYQKFTKFYILLKTGQN